MNSNRNALKAGLFIIAALAVVVVVVVILSGLDRVLTPWHKYTVTFKLTDDVGGLRVGDEVRVGGVKVGTVRRIQINQIPTRPTTQPADERPIVVVFEMPEKYVLRQNPRIRIQTSIPSGSLLNIDDLGAGDPWPMDKPLAGSPSMLSELAVSLGDTAPRVRHIMEVFDEKTLPAMNETVSSFKKTGDDAQKLLAHVDSKIDPIVEKYNVAANRAAEMMVEVRDIVGQSKGDIRAVAANLKDASVDVKQVTTDARQVASDFKQVSGLVKDKAPDILKQADTFLTGMNKAVDSANEALKGINTTVENVKDLTSAARTIITLNKSKLDGMIASVKATADNLKNASAEIRRSPWRLLYKPAPGEMANLNLYDSARQFADGASDLATAASALRDALKDPATDKEKLDKMVETLSKSFDSFQDVEKKLWNSVKE